MRRETMILLILALLLAVGMALTLWLGSRGSRHGYGLTWSHNHRVLAHLPGGDATVKIVDLSKT